MQFIFPSRLKKFSSGFFMFAFMRITTIVFIAFLFSCKSEKVPKTATAPSFNASKEINEEVISRLSQYYITNPSHPAHFEQNKIVDYAMQEGLDLIKTESGLFYQVVKKGIGAKLSKSEQLSVHYRGRLLNGKEFDSSYGRGEPIQFKIGQMIAGWNEGLTYLSHGDSAVFVIPSHLAYGKDGFPGFVGPNEILVFDLVIL